MLVIRQIEPKLAQALCDDYADKWETGRFETGGDSDVKWVGCFAPNDDVLGVLGYKDFELNRVRFVLSWHVEDSRDGKLSARELLGWCFDTLSDGWGMQGHVVAENASARNYLLKNGYEEAAVIFTKRKEAQENVVYREHT